MLRAITIISLVITLTGCQSNFTTLQTGLTQLYGKRLDTAMRYFGQPDSAYPLGDKQVYVWGVSDTYTRNVPVTVNHRGTISGNSGYSGYQGQSTAYVPHTAFVDCTVKITTNKQSIIVNVGYDGNQRGCSRYADAMKQYMDDTVTTGD